MVPATVDAVDRLTSPVTLNRTRRHSPPPPPPPLSFGRAYIRDQERAHELESPTLHTTPWGRRRRLGLLGRAYYKSRTGLSPQLEVWSRGVLHTFHRTPLSSP